jgi:hypothetical protein
VTSTSNAAVGVALALALCGATPAIAETTSPVVIELFTSQGCSSCPPANANLVTLSQRPNVLVLSFAVTYWDRLGWKDSFGKPEFTERQVVYEPALQQFGPYTPQMVVNGRTTAVGNDLAEVDALIANAAPLDGPVLDLGTAILTIGSGDAPAAGADIWRVTYDPNVVEVPVGRGENSGRTLAHTHVVHGLESLGAWTGDALDLPVTPAPAGLRTAILVQGKNGGPILATVTN